MWRIYYKTYTGWTWFTTKYDTVDDAARCYATIVVLTVPLPY